MKRILIAIIAIALMCVLSTGCSSNNSSTNNSTPSEQPEPTTSEVVQPTASEETPATSESITPPAAEPDLANAYAAYLNILLSNENNIMAHTWHRGNGVVAVRDEFGDATPEMFFLRATVGGFVAYLDIYTYSDGQAKQLVSIQVDEVAGAGYRYAMFTTPDGVYLYSSGPGEPKIFSFSKYELRDGVLTVTDEYMHKMTPSADYKITEHSYTHNGVTIEEEEYLTATSALIEAMDSHILYGGAEEEPIWQKIASIRNTTMNYEDAIAFLRFNSGDVAVDPTPSEPASKPSSGPFTEEMAIEYAAPTIMRDWGFKTAVPEDVEYTIVASDRLYDGETIYLVGYSIPRTGGDNLLVFADQTVINERSPEYANYNGYFDDIDITNLNQG